MYVFIVAYSNCYIFSFLLSHTICFSGKRSYKYQQLQDTFYIFQAADRAVITCAHVRDADN